MNHRSIAHEGGVGDLGAFKSSKDDLERTSGDLVRVEKTGAFDKDGPDEVEDVSKDSIKRGNSVELSHSHTNSDNEPQGGITSF